MPDATKKSPVYNFEGRFRALAEIEGVYILGMLSCCREKYDESIFKPLQIRGGTDEV